MSETDLSNRGQLARQHPGEYALVHGGVLVGFHPSFQAAYDAGVEAFGLDSRIWRVTPSYVLNYIVIDE
jgi:hypothetical protein